jgi:hypothetical protein
VSTLFTDTAGYEHPRSFLRLAHGHALASFQTLNNSEFITEREPRLRILIPMVVAVAFLMEQLDSTILTTAIPNISRSLATRVLAAR